MPRPTDAAQGGASAAGRKQAPEAAAEDLQADQRLGRLLKGIRGLAELTAEVASAPNLKGSLRTILGMAQGTFGVARGAIYHYSAETARLSLAAAVGEAAVRPALLTPTPEAIAHWVAGRTERDVAHGSSDGPLAGFLAANALEDLPRHRWVPLAVKGEFHGLLMVGEKADGSGLSRTDDELLGVLARQLAWALHHHALKFQLDLKVLELSRLQEISVALHSSLNRDTIVRDLVGQACELVKARKGLLLELEGDDLVVASSFGHPLAPGTRQPFAMHWLEPVMRENVTRVLALEAVPAELAASSAVAVPIAVRGHAAGVLVLLDKEQGMGLGAFTPDDQDLLNALAVQAAASMENARLYEMATVDALTRLYLRRHFEQRLAEEARRSQRYGTPLSLMMLDIDHFKKFNDTYGHSTGDDVLRLVAQVIRRNIREDLDLPARYGGEEMLVLMPETDPEGAFRLAERVRHAVESASLPGPGGQPLSVTVSVGVSTIPTHALNEKDLLEKADVALYDSKRAGRNRVTLALSP